MEWAWALRKDSTCLPSIHIKSREIASCPKLIPPVVKCWTNGIRRAILNAARKGCSEAINNRFTNETLLLRWARRRLRTSQWTAVQSDKDGGFVMCAKHNIPEIHAKLLTKDMYDERDRHEYDTQSVMKSCLKLAQKIAKYEDEPGLTHAIMKPWWNKNCSLASKLRITCKSHKTAGEVSFRNVHASVGYPLAGIAQWVVKKRGRKLGECNHLLKNSKQFVESLKGLRVHRSNYWIKFDIQDYYMSGNKDDLITDALATFEGDEKQLMKEALYLLLEEQWIMSNMFPDRIWKVCKGSGMGLLHSGDLADLAYYNRAERDWASCPAIMETYGIVKIWRFRDDILVLASERLKTHTYGRGMINKAGYFITKCEKVSHEKIEYLDCEVWIENGTIQSRPFIKPTNLGVPLQDTSCHPAHIHKSWPVSMVRRLGDLSTSHSYAEKAKDILIERFVKHLASPNLIDRLRATSTRQTRPSSRAQHHSGNRMWVTFPFHPVWSAHVTKAVGKFLNDESWSAILSQGFEGHQEVIDRIKCMRIAWYNYIKPHVFQIEQLSR